MAGLILVTGAAGFIGCNVVAQLNARGQDELILVDTLGCDEKWQNLLGLRYEDIITPEELLRRIDANACRDVAAVIHLGACSATTERDADFLLRNNYRYTRTLCEWSLKNDARFVYASSGATYGDGSRGYSDDDTVTPTLRPLNMYGYSKHMFDLWALKRGLFDRIVGLKYFNVFGPHEDHKGEMRSVVHRAFHQIHQTGEVTLFKSENPEYRDGEQMRDFVYVKDAAAVTLHFLDHPEIGGLFNCGTGQARTWNDLAAAVFAALGLQPRIRYIDLPQNLKGKYQYFTQADATKLKRQGGYTKPFMSLEDAVKDYVGHMKAPAK
jgi:ADP-L-glycero-D-manno-heptose 6-epimerase